MQDAINRDTGAVYRLPTGAVAYDMTPCEPVFNEVLCDFSAPISPLPFAGVGLGDTVFLAISDGVVMGVYHSELQAHIHGDEVQEWEVR